PEVAGADDALAHPGQPGAVPLVPRVVQAHVRDAHGDEVVAVGVVRLPQVLQGVARVDGEDEHEEGPTEQDEEGYSQPAQDELDHELALRVFQVSPVSLVLSSWDLGPAPRNHVNAPYTRAGGVEGESLLPHRLCCATIR